MKTKIWYPLLGSLALSLSGCQRDSDPVCADSVVGTWQLTNRVCFCAPRSSQPQEAIIFEPNGSYELRRAGQPTVRGTYTFATGTGSCNAGEPVVVLVADYSSYASSARYTIQNCTLTLDYGGCLDAPIDTFERQ